MKMFEAGKVILLAEHREGGPSLHLLIRMPAKPPQRETRCFQQVWRADCFRVNPHQHLFRPGDEMILEFKPADGEPIRWCASQLAKLSSIVANAGYPELCSELAAEQANINTQLPLIVDYLYNGA